MVWNAVGLFSEIVRCTFSVISRRKQVGLDTKQQAELTWFAAAALDHSHVVCVVMTVMTVPARTSKLATSVTLFSSNYTFSVGLYCWVYKEECSATAASVPRKGSDSVREYVFYGFLQIKKMTFYFYVFGNDVSKSRKKSQKVSSLLNVYRNLGLKTPRCYGYVGL